MKQIRTWKILSKNSFLYFNYFFWGLILFLGILEILFRIKYNSATPDIINEINEQAHYPRPYVMAAANPLQHEHYPLGYRDFPKVRKNKDEWRIAVLGGSTVYQDDVALPELLQNKIHSLGIKNARIYNIGNTSSVSRQDVLRIIIDLGGYQPDLIIHYGGGNDIIPSPDPRINYPHLFIFYEVSLYLSKSRSLKDWIFGFLMGSTMFRVIGSSYFLEHFLSKVPISSMVPPNYEYIKMKAYYENMLLGKMFADNIGAEFVSILQPILATKKQLTSEERRYISEKGIKTQTKLKKMFLSIVNSNPHSFNFHDCSNVFDPVLETVYKDIIHLLPKFQVYPADCIANFLKSRNDLVEFRNVTKPIFTPAEYFLTGKEN